MTTRLGSTLRRDSLRFSRSTRAADPAVRHALRLVGQASQGQENIEENVARQVRIGLRRHGGQDDSAVTEVRPCIRKRPRGDLIGIAACSTVRLQILVGRVTTRLEHLLIPDSLRFSRRAHASNYLYASLALRDCWSPGLRVGKVPHSDPVGSGCVDIASGIPKLRC